jgi:hypothetical protein
LIILLLRVRIFTWLLDTGHYDLALMFPITIFVVSSETFSGLHVFVNYWQTL